MNDRAASPFVLRLREARRVDHATLFSVVDAAFADQTPEEETEGNRGETIEDIHRAMLTARAVIAELDRRAIGVCFFEPCLDHMALFLLAVLRDERRHGVGGALVRYVERCAKVEGVRRVRLLVRASLPENHAFYARLGYREIAVRGRSLLLEKII